MGVRQDLHCDLISTPPACQIFLRSAISQMSVTQPSPRAAGAVYAAPGRVDSCGVGCSIFCIGGMRICRTVGT